MSTSNRPEKSADYRQNAAVLETNHPEITDLPGLLKFMKVDEKIWEVERSIVNVHHVVMREPATTVGGRGDDAFVVEGENGAKSTLWTRKSHIPVKVPLHQVKAWLKRRQPREIDEIKETLDKLTAKLAKASKVRKRQKISAKKNVMVELDIFDHHIGKLCWRKEVGHDWDVNIARKEFRRALDYLLAQVEHYDIAQFIFPFGNDFFHVDTLTNTTAKGTPQDVDGRPFKAFDIGTELMIEAVQILRQIAPVHLIPVNGNHDESRIYFLARILDAHFRKSEDITIDMGLDLRKQFQWGDCALGFTHGNEEKHTELPTIFNESFPGWGQKKFKEVHVGHWHQRKTIAFQPRQSVRRTQIKFLSSLTPPDAWHHRKGYEALRMATAFVWDKKDGNVAEFNYLPDAAEG